MGETTKTQPTLDDAGLGGLQFKAHSRRLLKIKSQFSQNIQQNLYNSIILLYFNAIALFTLVACDASNTGDGATYPRQDARYGRDAAATAGALTKTGGGAADSFRLFGF